MELVPWRPFEEFTLLRKEMDNLWNQFLDDVSFSKVVSYKWQPSIDISETKDKILIQAELPGMGVNDINVSISGNLLTIKGEKNKGEEDKEEHHYYVERYCGSFQRVVQLPTDVQGDTVKATFDKGVLKITLPKIEEARKKEIKIDVE